MKKCLHLAWNAARVCPTQVLSLSPTSAVSGPTACQIVELCFHAAKHHSLGPEDELPLSIHTQRLAVATWAPTIVQGRLLSTELRLTHWLLRSLQVVLIWVPGTSLKHMPPFPLRVAYSCNKTHLTDKILLKGCTEVVCAPIPDEVRQ